MESYNLDFSRIPEIFWQILKSRFFQNFDDQVWAQNSSLTLINLEFCAYT